MTAPVSSSYSPATVEEAAGAMRELAAAGSTVTFTGGGTKLGFGNPVSAEATVQTQRLDRVIDYAPEDLVVTVEAGMTLAKIQAHLAPHQQRLAFDAPEPERATIGGLIATNDFGQRRTRYGSLRDLILGVQFVNADGALARGGGKVVKNVAGFDLPKLMVGSFGTLGLIVSATFRLHPLAQAAAMTVFDSLTPSELRALTVFITAQQLEPAVVLGLRGAQRYTALVVFEGFAAGVEEQTARMVKAADALHLKASIATPDERALHHLRHQAVRAHGSLHVKITGLPSLIADLERDAVVPLCTALDDSKATIYPALGVAFVGGEPSDPDVAIATLRAAREVVERRGGSLVIRRAPDFVREGFDAWGTPPPAFELMERLKNRFDPQHRLNRGRFIGGL